MMLNKNSKEDLIVLTKSSPVRHHLMQEVERFSEKVHSMGGFKGRNQVGQL